MAQSSTMGDNDNRNALPVIVGIGASAGGIQSLESFLTDLPRDFGFAIVFIQHLSSKHKSILPELLQTQRPDLDFTEITDGIEVLPGKIYFHPPSSKITIQKGIFHLVSISGEHRQLPIDEFFIALAGEAAERVIAVIFSGAGTDGARGIQAVKATGGTVFVQTPENAEFTGMPIAAINTGQVDRVLPPRDIAREILKICGPVMEAISSDEFDSHSLLESFAGLLYDKTGYRFNHYKKNVIARRITRRMKLHGISSLNDYLEMLASKETEAERLASDLIIGVTSFFRDRLAWKALGTEVIRKLVAEQDDSPIRIWIPACATGEEAYSIAIAMQDELYLAGRKREMQIFASDINDHALEKARAGIYPESVSADVPPHYMKKFFDHAGDGLAVTVSKELRQHIVFAKHDILSNPPFSRMDLIICRNFLIYLEPYAQEKVICLFHYALRDGGYLFLGNAESLGSNDALFQFVGHSKDHIYRKVEGKALVKAPMSIPFSAKYVQPFPARPSLVSEYRPTVTEIVQKALLKEYAPAAVAISQNFEILYYSGATDRYLRQPEGAPTQNLLELLPDNLRSRIRSGVYRINRGEKPVSIRTNISAGISGGEGRKRQMTIRLSKLNEDLLLISFSEKRGRSPEPGAVPLDISALDDTAMRQLENELCSIREDLQSHIEQLESLSEELQSSNEELQAANEELETSKEELQSLNEELLTVNSQLENKIEEQKATNDDLINFLASTKIPTIFLDHQLRVRRFTPAMKNLIKLIPADMGRPIIDMSQESLGQDLIHDARLVMDRLAPIIREVCINSAWYVRSTLPYMTSESRNGGVVVTYSDVTEWKLAEESLRESEELYRSLFDNMLNGFAYCKMFFELDEPRDFIYLAVNNAFTTLTGLKDVVGKRVTEVIPGIRESDPELLAIYGRVALSGKAERFEMYVEALRMWFSISVYSPKKEYFVAVFSVITDRKLAEMELRESKERISQILNSTAEGIYGMDMLGKCVFCNPSGLRMLGYHDENALIGMGMHELVHHSKADGTPYPKDECAVLKAINEGEHIHRDKEILWRADGTNFPVEFWTHPISKNGEIKGAVVTFVDITERLILENQLMHAQKMDAIGTLAGGVAHDFNNILSVIIGCGELTLIKLSEDDLLRTYVGQILEAADRAAALTRSLLAFSSKQTPILVEVDLNMVVSRFEKFLQRLIREDIALNTTCAKDPLPVLADRGQVEQILMNLVTNARDAMPEGGRLAIETTKVVLEQKFVEEYGYGAAGEYALVSVSDTGVGMDMQTKARIFEPFFTTKELGKGTGLGLAVVYGIVKEHNGYMSVYSEPGDGTTFRVYLPLTEKAANTESPAKARGAAQAGGTETILMAEDDEALRKVNATILGQYGYTVMEAADGAEAVSMFKENKENIHLVILDGIMPKKNGIEAFREIKAIDPNIKCIFISGYAEDIFTKNGVSDHGVMFIPKPVAPDDFLKKIREVLDK